MSGYLGEGTAFQPSSNPGTATPSTEVGAAGPTLKGRRLVPPKWNVFSFRMRGILLSSVVNKEGEQQLAEPEGARRNL